MPEDQNQNPMDVDRICDLAKKTFGDDQTALEWLQTPLQRFQGRTPAEMCTTKAGALSVEELLTQIDDGMFA